MIACYCYSGSDTLTEMPYENRDEGDYNDDTERPAKKGLNHPAHVSQLKHGSVVNITLELTDKRVSKDGTETNICTMNNV